MAMLEETEAVPNPGQSEIRITRDRSNCIGAQIKASSCQHVEYSNPAETTESQVQLPEDILHLIHALMPMRYAAQAACVSTDFLRCWRSYPKLILSIDSLGIKEDTNKKDEMQRDFTGRVEYIMQNHSGKGIKKFTLETYPCSNLHPSYVDRWIQIATAPGIEEFELVMFGNQDVKYNFPCHFLSTERGSCIQSFVLADCFFHSAAQTGCMKSLKKLVLRSVHVTGEELYGFLSNSYGLEQFDLSNCEDIICLKIPHLLRQLNILNVWCCQKLEIIDSNAPKLSTFTYMGCPISISLGDALQVKKVIYRQHDLPGAIYYARTKLPFITPYLQTLILSSLHEEVNTPAAIGRFLHLKYLEIETLRPDNSTDYDFCSLVSFLDASPALETFVLRIGMPTVRPDSIVDGSHGDLFHRRCVSECCHDNLKKVMITGFCSAKSMIALTIHIVEKTKSLEYITLDTTRGHDRRHVEIDRCRRLNKDALIEANRALVAIRRYIEGRVSPGVNLKVIEPCSKCI